MGEISVFTFETLEGWLAWRRLYIGASEAPALFGEHEFLTSFELAARKSGAVADKGETVTMRRGRFIEGPGLEALAEERPDWEITRNALPELLYWCNEEARLGCTPDAFATRPDIEGRGVIQVKSVHATVFKRKWVVDGIIEPPMYACIQASLEAAMTGCSWAVVLAVVVDWGIDLHVVDIPLLPADVSLLGKARELCKLFWDRVDRGEPFQPDYERDADLIKIVYRDVQAGKMIDLSNDNSFAELAFLDREEANAEKIAHERRAAIKAEALAKMGDAEIALINGQVYATAKRVDVKEKCVRAYSFRKVHFKKDGS